MNYLKINYYLLLQICKYFFLILFIFLSVAWLLQLTRLFTITNFMHIQIYDIIFLSIYLIPNIVTVILPFILIFGLLLCFIKLNKDNELIAILSLGMGLKPFKNTLVIFSLLIVSIFILLNFYFAPKVYEVYKIKEFDLRNKVDINKMNFSNFLNLNKTTILDFKKKNNEYIDIFINFSDEKENLVYAEKGKIFKENSLYNFQLINGFKISIDNLGQIEKLEFRNYTLKIENRSIINNNIVDRNTFTIFDDFQSKNYLNISFKLIDIILIFYIVILFYNNNLKRINFNAINNIYFSIICIIILIINQIFKNSEVILFNYTVFIVSTFIFTLLISYLKKRYEQN